MGLENRPHCPAAHPGKRLQEREFRHKAPSAQRAPAAGRTPPSPANSPAVSLGPIVVPPMSDNCQEEAQPVAGAKLRGWMEAGYREDMLFIASAYLPLQGPLGPNPETNIPLVSLFIFVCVVFFCFVFFN